MLGLPILVFSFLLLSSGLTQAQQQTEGGVPGAFCKECHDALLSDFTQVNQLLSKIEDNVPLSCNDKSSKDCVLFKWIAQKDKTYPKSCNGFFVDKQGHLGSYSKTIEIPVLQDMMANQNDSIYLKDNPDFDRLCPGFKTMTPLQKASFHAWIFELTAFPESACNLSVPANNAANVPNGPAVCLYQLELSPSLRSWRSAKFKQKNCAVSATDILTLQGCTGCAMDEYKRHSVAYGSPFGETNDRGQLIHKAYWASHNPLSPTQKACMEKYYDVAHNRDKMANGKPLWLTSCRGANLEWRARYKFFFRIGRFPLCGTPQSDDEVKQLPQ